jgi:hypothetical protein
MPARLIKTRIAGRSLPPSDTCKAWLKRDLAQGQNAAIMPSPMIRGLRIGWLAVGLLAVRWRAAILHLGAAWSKAQAIMATTHNPAADDTAHHKAMLAKVGGAFATVTGAVWSALPYASPS